MTPAEREAIDALYAKATKGEWRSFAEAHWRGYDGTGSKMGAWWAIADVPDGMTSIYVCGKAENVDGERIPESDAKFIAAIHNAWPSIKADLEEFERLREWAAKVDARNRILFPVYNEKPEDT
jgi:hypothetical protein